MRRLRSRIGVLGLPELLDDVLEVSGYRAMLADGTEENEERWRNLLELRSVTTRYDDLAPDDALDRLLEETALVADQDAYEADADAVTLITLHAAKGLEFGAVFISGMEEGVFPHSRALDDATQLEEERRLAYVGITRAKERLFLSHAWQRATWGPGGGGPSVAVALPLRDPRRPDGGAAPPAGGGERRRLRPRPRLRRPAQQPFRHRDPGRWRRLPGGERPPRRTGERPALRAESRPRRPPRAPSMPGRRRGRWPSRGGGAFGDAPATDEDHPDAAFADDLPVRRLPPRRRRRAAPRPRRPSAPRVRVPGERLFRDGDRVAHARFGDGVVVTSKLTRDDEEVTVAFRNGGVKTLLASMAHLEHAG